MHTFMRQGEYSVDSTQYSGGRGNWGNATPPRIFKWGRVTGGKLD